MGIGCCQSLQGLLRYFESILVFHLSDIGGFILKGEKKKRIPCSRKTKSNFHRLFLNGYGTIRDPAGSGRITTQQGSHWASDASRRACSKNSTRQSGWVSLWSINLTLRCGRPGPHIVSRRVIWFTMEPVLYLRSGGNYPLRCCSLRSVKAVLCLAWAK